MKHFSLGDRKGRPYAEVIDKRKFETLRKKMDFCGNFRKKVLDFCFFGC